MTVKDDAMEVKQKALDDYWAAKSPAEELAALKILGLADRVLGERTGEQSMGKKSDKKLGEKPERVYGSSTESGYERIADGWKIAPGVYDKLGIEDEAAIKDLLSSVTESMTQLLRRIYVRRNRTMTAIRKDLNLRDDQHVTVRADGTIKVED